MSSGTVIWNGPAGVFEFDNFSKGTKAVLDAVAALHAAGHRGIIGGGDSATAAAKWDMEDKVSFVRHLPQALIVLNRDQFLAQAREATHATISAPWQLCQGRHLSSSMLRTMSRSTLFGSPPCSNRASWHPCRNLTFPAALHFKIIQLPEYEEPCIVSCCARAIRRPPNLSIELLSGRPRERHEFCNRLSSHNKAPLVTQPGLHVRCLHW